MNVLFIGRFQPFHLGHLKLITHIYDQHITLQIGVGSSQYHHTLQNPFDYHERTEMIQRSLKDSEINRFLLYAVPDIHDPTHWVEHVQRIIPDFNQVVTTNSFTKQLFEEKGYLIIEPPLFQRSQLSGKHIRHCIIKNKTWNHLVPEAVFDYIHEINGVQRLQEIARHD